MCQDGFKSIQFTICLLPKLLVHLMLRCIGPIGDSSSVEGSILHLKRVEKLDSVHNICWLQSQRTLKELATLWYVVQEDIT